ncbi:hypothetical protein BS50DRAFT_634999 [Corynespora cassiicola Philippines]|uniref:Nephrocystin 3-like N-terminal domain-containing protein n=1 Tax=Corynespora cassiicola Philippines TaxID=1448308 RepID=A0A2T2NK92_CORCC|nr:hypothetical protein BS50DRAFT_634999 [Corynespora cassiicola Philippines]
MSFGTSIGDIIKIVELASDVRKRFVDSPAQFKAISSYLSFLLEQIEDVLPNRNLTPENKQKLKEAHTECESVLQAIQAHLKERSDIVNIGSGSKIRRFQVAWKRLQWNENQITEYRERLLLGMRGFNMLLQSLTSDEVFKISQELQKIGIRENNREEARNKKDILDKFSTFDNKAKHQHQLEGRCDGTGQWFLESTEFKQFSSNSSETLVCHGIPGAGKTIIAATAIDHLDGLRQNDSTVGLAYFYFSYDSRFEQTPEVIFKSLAYQLFEQRAEIPDEEEP